jgi:hypothetical protein
MAHRDWIGNIGEVIERESNETIGNRLSAVDCDGVNLKAQLTGPVFEVSSVTNQDWVVVPEERIVGCSLEADFRADAGRVTDRNPDARPGSTP